MACLGVVHTICKPVDGNAVLLLSTGRAIHTLRSGGVVDSVSRLASNAIDVAVLAQTALGEAGLGVIVENGVLDRAVDAVYAILDRLVVDGVASVGSVDKGLETGALARVALQNLLVLAEGGGHLVIADVVQEDAGAERVGHSSAKLAVACLENGGGGLLENVFVKLWVVHAEAGTGEEVKNALVLGIAEEAAHVGEGGTVGHVDGDGMTVAKRDLGNQLVHRGPALSRVSCESLQMQLGYLRVAVGDDTVKANFVKVWGLELQHLKDAVAIDVIGGLTDFLSGIVAAAKGGADELLAVLSTLR